MVVLFQTWKLLRRPGLEPSPARRLLSRETCEQAGAGLALAILIETPKHQARKRSTEINFFFSRRKNQPKEEVFGMDIPRTAGGPARISRPKTSVRAFNILERQGFGRGHP